MAEDAKLISIPLAAAKALAAGSSRVNVYLPSRDSGRPVLYSDSASKTSGLNYERLSEGGVSHLLVAGEELTRCEQALESHLTTILDDPNIHPTEKAECVQYVGTTVAHALIDDGPAGLDRAENLLEGIIGAVLADPDVAASLLNVSGHHRTTASHLFAVSTLSIMLGAEIYGPDAKALRDVGMAGMLHDLGKIKIAPSILNKTGTLSPEEVQLIQHHPIESLRLIGDNQRMNANVRQMVLQHHERVDGKGYPLGLTDTDLLVGSKILAVVDAFHAMTGRRLYRSSLTPADACNVLRCQIGKQLDATIFAAWEALFRRCWNRSFVAGQKPVPDAGVAPAYHRDHGTTPKRRDLSRRRQRNRCPGTVVIRCFRAARLEDGIVASPVIDAPVFDISSCGMCLTVATPMYRGEIVHIRIREGSPPSWVRGIVRWCHRDAHTRMFMTGIELTNRLAGGAESAKAVMLGMDDPELFPAVESDVLGKPTGEPEPGAVESIQKSVAGLGSP